VRNYLDAVDLEHVDLQQHVFPLVAYIDNIGNQARTEHFNKKPCTINNYDHVVHDMRMMCACWMRDTCHVIKLWYKHDFTVEGFSNHFKPMTLFYSNCEHQLLPPYAQFVLIIIIIMSFTLYDALFLSFYFDNFHAFLKPPGSTTAMIQFKLPSKLCILNQCKVP